MKKLIIAFIILIVIALVATGGAYLWYQDAVYSRTSITEEQEITVEEGETLFDIAPLLTELNLLKDETALRIFLRLESPEVNLQAGTYQIPGGMNVPELIEYLNLGPQVFTVRVTIQEGLRSDEVSALFDQAFSRVSNSRFLRSEYDRIVAAPSNYEFTPAVEEFLTKAQLTGNLEGFLFPDTYNLGVDANALDVINLQLTTLIQRLTENNIPVAGTGSLQNFAEVINLASIVEREANTPLDKKMVADIFLRRMAIGWNLGADAPVLYPYKRWTPPPNLIELEANDPYNARKFAGLPPTPIASPGIDSILGVVSPTPNDYLYFLHDPRGQIYYARTLEEHNINIANYL